MKKKKLKSEALTVSSSKTGRSWGAGAQSIDFIESAVLERNLRAHSTGSLCAKGTWVSWSGSGDAGWDPPRAGREGQGRLWPS